MGRTKYLFAAAVVAAAVTPGLGRAQQPAPGVPAPARPVFSPYLNLLRRDASPAINYYGIVRPQINTMNALQMQQQQISTIARQETQNQGAGAAAADLPVTGQPAYFLNTGGYFLNNRVSMGAVGPVNPSVTTRRPAAPTMPGPPPRAPGVRR